MAEYLQAPPRRKALGLLADALTSGQEALNTVNLPYVGGLGGLLLGQAPEYLQDVSYGMPAFRGGNVATGGLGTLTPDTRMLDVATLPFVGAGAAKAGQVGAKTLGKEIARQVETGTGLLGSNVLDPRQYATAYHGSPYMFEQFDMNKLGTGIGQSLRGKGMYFSDSPQIAEDYAKRLGIEKTSMSQLASDYLKQDVPPSAIKMLHDVATSSTPIEEAAKKVQYGSIDLRNQSSDTLTNIISNFRESSKGITYKVDIPDKNIPKMLDWEKPLSEQSLQVQKSWEKLVPKLLENNPRVNDFPGDNAARALQNSLVNKSEGTLGDLYYALQGVSGYEASKILRQNGIKGIKYSSVEENLPKVQNYVVFNPKEVKILEKKTTGLLK